MDQQFNALLDGIGTCSINDHGDQSEWTMMEEISKDRKRNAQYGRQMREKTNQVAATNVIDEMLQIISDKESEIERLKAKNEETKRRINETEKRSNAITKEMAKMIDDKGNFESLNSEFSNLNITEKFYKLYDNDWVSLSRRLGKLYNNLTELDIIHNLTQMLKFVYEECCNTADSQIRQFFLLTEDEAKPLAKEYPELFSIRRKYARTEAVRTRLIHDIWIKLKATEEMDNFAVGEYKAEKVKNLKTFFDKYIDCCWLITVSNPPLQLNFDVIGTHYSECTEYFRIYSLKQPVVGTMKEVGTICEVVWPSVCLQDGDGCYKKGDVVIFQTRKKTDTSCSNENL